MARFPRKLLALLKAEATYGVDSVPTPAANAILLRNPQITPIDANNVPRDLVRPYFGNSEELVGTRSVQFTFGTELVGSGTLGTAPAWAPLIRACGFAETTEAGVRVDYLPITDDIPSVTAYVYDDGVLHQFVGARGSARLRLVSGELAEAQWSFRGLYAPVAAAVPGVPSYAAWRTSEVPTNANTAQLTLGATINATLAPALTGGTQVPSLGIEVDIGNDVSFVPLIGGESVDITNRAVAGNVRLDLNAAQEVSRVADVLAATLSSVGMFHGQLAARKVGLFMPSVQFTNYRKDEFNGRRLIQYDLRGVPVAGNDELRIVTSF